MYVIVLINFNYSRSSRPLYGDDAINYVQLKREGNICTVKCKICPEHKVHAKLYSCKTTLLKMKKKWYQSNAMIVLLLRADVSMPYCHKTFMHKTHLNYIKKPSNICFGQIQMYLCGLNTLNKCYFCVADPNFTTNNNFEILCTYIIHIYDEQCYIRISWNY